MEARLGFVGIMVEDREQNISAVNDLLTEFGAMVIGRMGIPYHPRNCCVITLIVDTDTDTLGRFTGQLGSLPGVSVKSALHKSKRGSA